MLCKFVLFLMANVQVQMYTVPENIFGNVLKGIVQYVYVCKSCTVLPLKFTLFVSTFIYMTCIFIVYTNMSWDTKEVIGCVSQ